MAGLHDLAIATVGTQKYVFRVTKGFYTGAIEIATGITTPVPEADLDIPISPVDSLLRAGVLRTANANATLGTKKFRVKIHYTNAKAATVEAAIVGAVIPTVTGRKNSGATFVNFTNPLKVTSRS